MTSDIDLGGPRKPTTRTREGGARSHTKSRNRANFIQRWALLGVWVVLIIVFSVIEPNTFLSMQNFQSLLGSQAILLLLTLGLMVPLTTGDFDLSIGSVLSLSAMVVAVLNAQHHWPVGLAVLVGIAIGLVVGLVNATLTVALRIDSLIATLGMGTVAAGITLWVSDSQTISGVSDALINAVVGFRLFGIPIEFYYGLIVCVALWYVFDHTSLGRRMLFTGRGRKVARLSGVNVSRIRFGALVTSGVLASVSGLLYAGTSGAANPGAGEPLLLPAFAAVFLGSTAISSGRFNPWGTFIAVYFLSSGITGLQLLGVSSFVQNLFYGGALIIAVVFAQLARRRHARNDED
ncbi:ABC transporter permease [Sphaerisporangium perillae]|uniref:ABC transporter permease n=1 Tax=Sphaerisporangium perillae TaxID=2935860 RepID=UPI00200C344F|nr:ABC transporter permease [Sphaerisporangium perillae]